jgi:hypothetical protein
MKFRFAILPLAALVALGCQQTPVERATIPPNDPRYYGYQEVQKPLDPAAMGIYAPPPPPQGGNIPAPPPPLGGGAVPPPPPPPAAMQLDPTESAFVKAYQDRRAPRIMILVNRTIHAGATLPADSLEALARQADPKEDAIGATAADYDMVEASLVDYFNHSGNVTVKDAEAARGKLDREKLLRIENGDPDAVKLLATEFQTDILIRVVAVPTRQARQGVAARLIARAVSTTDGTFYGIAMKDMTLPMSKTNINEATWYVSRKLMDDMSRKLAGQNDPLEVRIYKAKNLDETLLIRKFIQKIPGVTGVRNIASTGGSTTAYAALSVNFNGAPEDFYIALKDDAALSKGLKASDITNNTINIEVEGPLDLKVQANRTNAQGKTETVVEPVTIGEK